jgi:outer membrane receptor for ferrienterochelin and colicins
MRRALLVAALLLPATAAAAGAQGQAPRSTVRGRVLERGSEAPVGAAEVSVGGATVTADPEGRWSLAGLTAGTHTLRVRRIGYAPATLVLTLGTTDTTLTVRLVPRALPLDEVVVTAARREQRLADVAVPTEIIGRAALEETGASDLAAALVEQTGIQFDGGHPSGAGVMLQGLSSERVLVLLDGQPLYGRISGTMDLARIPTAIVERVEVVKGPQAALYGSEAMGGVVNIVTRGPGGAGLGGGARIVAGSAGRRDAGVTGEMRSGPLAAVVDVGRRDIDRAAGRSSETGALAERFDGNARITLRADSALDLEAAALVLDERQRWPTGQQYDFADNNQVSARLGADWHPEGRRLRSTLYLSRFEHLARRSAFTRPIAGTGDRQTQRLLEGELLYGSGFLGHALDLGLEVRQERISSTDGRIEGGSRTLWSVEPFAQLDWSTPRWSIVPGVRLSWNERWGSTLTPRLATRYRLSDALSIRAAAGRGFRAPDFKELYLQFVNDAAGYAVYGNDDLRPEHSTNITAGLEWTGARLYGRAQLFWNDLHDFIETRAEPAGSGGLLRFRYANVARGRTYGAELEGGWVLPSARFELGYAYLGTEDGATGRPLLGRPVHSARAVTTVSATRSLRATVTGVWTGPTPMERDETGGITSERDAFLRMDARLAHRLPWGLELAVGADNLFDTRPDAWADAVGRQWYLGLTWLTSTRP